MNDYLVENKICSDCRIEKHASQFGRQRSRTDGLQSKCKQCKNAARRTTNRVYLKPAAIVENYKFLRGHGVDHRTAAERIGVVPEYLRQVTEANGCHMLEPTEQDCLDRIMLCIERGKTFSYHDMPLGADENGNDFNVAVNVAVRRGLCVPVGKRVHVLSVRGGAVNHYRGVAVGVLAVA